MDLAWAAYRSAPAETGGGTVFVTSLGSTGDGGSGGSGQADQGAVLGESAEGGDGGGTADERKFPPGGMGLPPGSNDLLFVLALALLGAALATGAVVRQRRLAARYPYERD